MLGSRAVAGCFHVQGVVAGFIPRKINEVSLPDTPYQIVLYR
jgi:hypothetical protein